MHAGTCRISEVQADRWYQMDRIQMWYGMGVGSDEEHSQQILWVLCAVVWGGGCVILCSMWNKVVGGMKLSVDLAVSPPFCSLILLPYITQCACERTYHGGTPGCLEWVCTDNVAKSGGCQKRKKVPEKLDGVLEHRKGSQSTRRKSDGWLRS